MRKAATWIAVCVVVVWAIAFAGCKAVTESEFVAVESVTLNAMTLTLAPGGTRKLTATVTPDNADDKTVTWSSSDADIAVVDDGGMVTAVAEGTATITAQAGGKSAACAVTVCVHSYSGDKCMKCGFSIQGDDGKTELMPTAVLTIENKSSYVLYDVEWNGTSISSGGEIAQGGSQMAPVVDGKACVYFSFYPKSGDIVKMRCHTDSEIGIVSGGAASFAFTDETIVVQSDYEANKNALKYVRSCGLVIENGVVVKCYRGTFGTVVIPDGVTSIKYDAFEGCTLLASVTIPASVASIGSYAFSGCTSLESVTIPDSVTSIGSYAFSGCTSLESVTIPASVTEIGSYAFMDCTSLASVTIGNGVTSIEGWAFYGCTKLTSVTIPDSVTSIGTNAFGGCTSLTSVTYEGTKEDWESIEGINDSRLSVKTITGKDKNGNETTWTCN